jgi:hypothetical protein
MNGSITINGHERNLSQFRKLSCYIMQDNQLHANLTVEEAMRVASNLKLGKDMTKDEKQEVVSFGTCFRQLCDIKNWLIGETFLTCFEHNKVQIILIMILFLGVAPHGSGHYCRRSLLFPYSRSSSYHLACADSYE